MTPDYPVHHLLIKPEYQSLPDFLRQGLSNEVRQRPLLVTFTQWDYALAAVGELVMTLRDLGSEPVIAPWSGRTPMLDVGWLTSHRVAAVLGSNTMDQRLVQALAGSVPLDAIVSRPPIVGWTPHEAIDLPESLKRSAIRQLTYRGSPMGRAILQVPPSARTPSIDDVAWPRRFVHRAALSYAFVFDQTLALIRQRQATVAVVFNGRLPHDRAVAEAARYAGLPVIEYDSGGLATDFDVTFGSTHDFSAYQSRMLRAWKERASPESRAIASSWFHNRVEHKDPDSARFTDAQQRGKGVDLDPDRRTVVYFSSSNDEIAELEIDWTQYFGNQELALRTLAEACRAQNLRLVVRSHPHKRHKPIEDLDVWLSAVAAAKPDVHFDHHSAVDSYTLMQQADIVVTYGSTTGVEAAFVGKPVIVMGPSIYDELGCATRVRDGAELAAALEHADVGAQQGALALGLMMHIRGFRSSHVTKGVDGVYILNGVRLAQANKLTRHLSYLWRRAFNRWLTR